MKALVIIAHPQYEKSRVNRAWASALEASGLVTVHPVGGFGRGMDAQAVRAEQRLIEQHDAVVLQFPLYDFYMPAVGKIWLDEVFSWGWAFGLPGKPEQNRMTGMKIAAAVSCGCTPADFAKGGSIGIALSDCLSPLPAFCRYGQARWMGLHTLLGAGSGLSDEALAANAAEYVGFVRRVLEG